MAFSSVYNLDLAMAQSRRACKFLQGKSQAEFQSSE